MWWDVFGRATHSSKCHLQLLDHFLHKILIPRGLGVGISIDELSKFGFSHSFLCLVKLFKDQS